MTIEETEALGGMERPLGTRLTLFLGEPHNVVKEFNSLYYCWVQDDRYNLHWDRALSLLETTVGLPREDTKHIEEYEGLYDSLIQLTSDNPLVWLNLPETNLSERLQVALIQEAIKSGKRLFIYTQSEVILLECMLGIKEGLLNLEEVKLYMVEGKEVTDVELLKGGRFKSFGDSFPGSVRSSQMKRYVGF
jgi:hypothetical protein